MLPSIGKIFRSLFNHKFKSILLLLFLMLLMRLLWGWSVHRQLQSQLSAIRARGEPIDPSQITHQPLPEDQNTVPLLRKAVSALVEGVDSPRNSNLEYPDFLLHSPQWMKFAEASEKAHGPAFALARAARQRQQAQFATSLPEEIEPHFINNVRTLANVLNDGAEYSHIRGNDTEAIERLLDALHLARALAADDFLISYMVAIGIDASTCHSIYVIGPGLSAPAARIRPLIDQLLDEEFHQSSLKRTLLNERVRQIRWRTKAHQHYWLLSPLAERDLIRELPNFENYLEAADCTDFQQAHQVLQRCRSDFAMQVQSISWIAPSERLPRYSRWFQNWIDFSPRIERCYRVLAERRVTAVSLACQLYRADMGQFPQTLNQLVPKYLSAIPADPFFSDGRPIGYAIKTHTPPLKGPRPVLYFDPGGSDVALKPEPHYSWYSLPIPGAPVRQYRDISRFLPASPKAVNNNPNKPDDPGKNTEEKDAPH
jgi:hypothetical protein